MDNIKTDYCFDEDVRSDWEDALHDSSLGDARRCEYHPHVRTSSSDGMFDAPCNECEAEMDDWHAERDAADDTARHAEYDAMGDAELQKIGLGRMVVDSEAMEDGPAFDDEIPF